MVKDAPHNSETHGSDPRGLGKTPTFKIGLPRLYLQAELNGIHAAAQNRRVHGTFLDHICIDQVSAAFHVDPRGSQKEGTRLYPTGVPADPGRQAETQELLR